MIKPELLGKEITLSQRTIVLSNNLRPSQIKLLLQFRPEVFITEELIEAVAEAKETKIKKTYKKPSEKDEENIF
jgi:hypothetical protein